MYVNFLLEQGEKQECVARCVVETFNLSAVLTDRHDHSVFLYCCAERWIIAKT